MAKTSRRTWSQPIVKALFGRAANQCSICQDTVTELPQSTGDKIAVVGEIGHINAISSNGPRGKGSLSEEELNDYDNLILICANCHRKIDRQEVTYTVEELKRLKKDHENRNEELLSGMKPKKAASILSAYLTEFKDAYEGAVKEIIPSEFRIENQILNFSDTDFQKALMQDIIILGPSGCGKSLLATYIGVKVIDDGVIPIVIQAVQFSQQIEPSLEDGTGLLSMGFNDIDRACTALKKDVLLVIDGYNECPDALRVKLNLWIVSFYNRQKTRVVITSQNKVDGLKQIGLKVVEVLVPGFETKKLIACSKENDLDLKKISPLLEIIGTGLEAKLLGVVAQTISANSGRYDVFDLYVRKSLGTDAEFGINVLSIVAKYLYARVTFSLSVRDFERLLSVNKITQSVDFLFKANLLTKRANRIAFGHELFLNAYSAEAIIRNAHGDSNKIIEALSVPKHKEHRIFTVNAIDDIELLDSIFPSIKNFDLVVSCIAGDCGAYAREWANERCSKLFKKTMDEINALTFEIESQDQDGDKVFYVSLDKTTLTDWNEQDVAFIYALPLLVFEGKYLAEVFDVVSHMDLRLSEEFTRLRPMAVEKKIALRSEFFRQIYLGFSSGKTFVGMVFSNLNSGGWNFMGIQASIKLFEFSKNLLESDRYISDGQLYLIIQLAQLFRWNDQNWNSLLPPYLPDFLANRWRFSPYNLKLALLDAARYSNDSAEHKEKIVGELNKLLEVSSDNPIMSTSIFDALQGLGALQDDEIEYEQTVIEELAGLLKDEEDPKNWTGAYRFITSIIDHPYQGAYWKVFDNLSGTEAKKLNIMALKGAANEHSLSAFCVPIILGNVTKYEDPSISDYVSVFTKLPPKNYNHPQEGIEVFLLAHIILGWQGASLTSQLDTIEDSSGRAIAAYAEAIYWANRRDLKSVERTESMKPAWKILLDHEEGVSADTLRNYSRVFQIKLDRFSEGKDMVTTLNQEFEDQFTEIFRECIRNPETQKGYFSWTKQDEILRHAIQGLGYSGGLTDIALLKKWINANNFGETAIRAIKNIELRFKE